MIRIFFKTLLFKLFRQTGWPKIKPINFTLGISCQCNSRCQTCNIWKKKLDELKLSEWEKILKNIGPGIYWVTISGGEPFLQKHLSSLTALTAKYLKPKIINIPTNSILTDQVVETVKIICEENKKTSIVINLSLDGKGDDHDKIRGVQGNFEKVLKTYQGLKSLDYKNLTVGIHTVISKFNVNVLANFFEYVLSELKPDQYITEIAEERVELDTVNMDITPSAGDYEKIIDLLSQKISQRKFKGLARVTEAFRLEYYCLVKEYLKKKVQPIPCFAGIASAQISADGEVWPCCIRADNLGNLRKHNYDFNKIWFSEKAGQVRKSIKDKECACPLANAHYTNMLCHYRTLSKVITHLSS